MTTSYVATKSGSLGVWGVEGYVETWDGYDRDYTNDVLAFVDEALRDRANASVLEIGAGGGYWTGHLLKRAGELTAIDVIDKPEKIDSKVKWITRGDHEYHCGGVGDSSVDLVFSFGVFCHFKADSRESYLRDIYRVLKPDGSAVVMFGDSEKCPEFSDYNTKELTLNMVAACGFEARDLLDYRDTLLLLTKRSNAHE